MLFIDFVTYDSYCETCKKSVRIGTHVTLEGGEVDVGDEKNGLRLELRHCLEDSDVAALVHEGHLDIWPN